VYKDNWLFSHFDSKPRQQSYNFSKVTTTTTSTTKKESANPNNKSIVKASISKKQKEDFDEDEFEVL
jgi:hypothetical protein